MDTVVVNNNIKDTVKKVFKDCLTGINGKDYDPARVVGYAVVIIGAVVFIGLSIYDTIINKKFDYTGYATGLAGVGVTITAAAAGVWFKKDTEAKE